MNFLSNDAHVSHLIIGQIDELIHQIPSSVDRKTIAQGLRAIAGNQPKQLETFPADLKKNLKAIQVIVNPLNTQDSHLHKLALEQINKHVSAVENLSAEVERYLNLFNHELQQVLSFPDKEAVLHVLQDLLRGKPIQPPVSFEAHAFELQSLLRNSESYFENLRSYEYFQQLIQERLNMSIKSLLLPKALEPKGSQENSCQVLRRRVEIARQGVQPCPSQNNQGYSSDHDEALLATLKDDATFFQSLPFNLKNDKTFVLRAVKENGSILQYVPERFKNNEKIVLEAVANQGDAFQYASEELKNKPTVILAAIDQNYDSIKYASKVIRGNKDLMLAAIEKKGYIFRYVSDELKDNKDIVMAATRKIGSTLGIVLDKFRDDKDVVLAAIHQDCQSLKYASDRLKEDPDVILSATLQNPDLFVYASESLKSNKRFILRVLRKNSFAIKFIADSLKNDEEIAAAAVQQNGLALQF